MSQQQWSKCSLLVLIIVLLLASGCSGQSGSEPQAAPTEMPPTATAEPSLTPSPVPTSTNTPEPSPTPTEVPTDTPEPTATVDLAATAAFESTQAAEEALAIVGEELAKYDLTTDIGHLAWVSAEPIEIVSQPGGWIFYEPIDEGTEYTEYVLHIDVTWESDTGLAGCGVMFHSEPNLEEGKQYQFWAARFSGLPVWSVELYEYGYYVSSAMGESKVNSAINQENGSLNTYVLEVHKGVMTAYANGKRLSNVLISSLDHGRIGFFLWQESGKTSCTFENAWIWDLSSE